MVSDPVELGYFAVQAIALLCLSVNFFFSLTFTVIKVVNLQNVAGPCRWLVFGVWRCCHSRQGVIANGARGTSRQERNRESFPLLKSFDQWREASRSDNLAWHLEFQSLRGVWCDPSSPIGREHPPAGSGSSDDPIYGVPWPGCSAEEAT